MLEYANKPFEWGVLDCCQFTARVAHKITGIDYSKGFQYLTEDDAAMIVNSKGGLVDLVESILGCKPSPIEELKVGDPVIVLLPVIGDALGVYAGHQVICKSTNGTLTININRIIRGWHLA